MRKRIINLIFKLATKFSFFTDANGIMTQPGITEYENKQFKNVKYIGDTIVNNSKGLVLSVNGYNYLSGSKDDDEQFLVSLTDSGYYSGYQFIPFKNYTN